MKNNGKYILSVVFITTFLTWFFYIHERFPKPVRAFTALLGTPVAIASGISYYLHLGIPVYESTTAVIFSNLLFSILFVLLINFIMKKRKKKNL